MQPTLIAAALLLAAAACTAKTAGPPDIVVDRTACTYCGMLISETIYAAAYLAPGSEPLVFDDIGCLLKSARAETATNLRFWFHDASDGEWFEGDAVFFVTSPEIRTPMGGGVIAFRDAAGAERAAGRHRGEVVRSIAELMTRKGDRR